MAGQVLAIRRLATRFRVRRGVRVGRLRLEGLVRDATAGPLEAALVRAGVPVDEEICIRRVQARTALDLALTDATLALAWSTGMALAIRAALDRGGDDIVRYPTRRLALVDLVVAVAGGELRRAWAWRQLGLWPARQVAAGPAACTEAARVLAAHPRLAIPVLREVARLGALPRLLVQAAPTALAAIAEAAFPGVTRGARSPDGADQANAAIWQTAAARLARRSLVARAAAAALAQLQAQPAGSVADAGSVAELRRVLAVLSLLDAEPAAATRDAGSRAGLLAALEAMLAPETGRIPPIPGGAPEPTAARNSPAAPESAATPEPDRAAIAGAVQGLAGPPAADSSLAVPLSRRDRGITRAGGLLYLIHLVGELALARDFLDVAPLCARPLPWTLHRLALALRPLRPDDPAALAFAGLGPGAPIPAGDDPPTELEAHAVAAAAERVVERLRGRLGRPNQPREDLLDEVCARRAEILADPGWIEARLDLDDVSADLRRAGLDLDPDWVPWLGVVVRFVYA